MAKILLKTRCSRNELGVTKTNHYYDTVERIATFEITVDADQCNLYSRSTEEQIDSYCDDGNLHEIFHNGNGGIVDNITQDSPSCPGGGGEPEGCELAITGIDVTHETTAGANDGTATIHSTLTPNNIEYQLGSRFQYDNNVFTGLSPGDYEIIVRDISLGGTQTAEKCEDSQTFKIEEAISYNPKWTFEYKDKQERWSKIIILGKNYEGEPAEVEVGNEPVSIDWKGRGSNNTILPSELIMELVAEDDFEYLSLFSSDDKAHRVDFHKTDQYGIYHLFWTGYIVPDVYQEAYTDPPYLIRVSAIDGLVNLKSIKASFIEDFILTKNVILECLRQTKVGLNLYESIDLYEKRNASSNIYESAINQQYVRSRAYMGLTYFEVLENLISSYGARLYQTEGAWHIIPKEILKNELYPWRYFDLKGGPVQLFSSRKPNLEIGSSRLGKPLWLNNAQLLEVSPGWKQASILQDFGTKSKILGNGEFEEDSFKDGQLIGWTGPHFMDTYKEDEDDELKYIVSLQELGAPENSFIQKTVPIEHNTSVFNLGSATIHFKTSIRMVNDDKIQEIFETDPIHVGFLINIGDRWLHADGSWGEKQFYICELTKFNEFQDFEIESDFIPSEGDLTVYCGGWRTDARGAIIYNEVRWTQIDYITIDFLPNGKFPIKQQRFILENPTEGLTYIPEDKKQFHGDPPKVFIDVDVIGGGTYKIPITPKNARNIFLNSFYVWDDGYKVTNLWNRFGKTEEERLSNLILNRLLASNSSPKQVLTGTLEGDNITLHNTFTDQYNPGKIFFVNSMTYRDRSKQYDVELMELAEFEIEVNGGRLLETGAFRLLEDGGVRLLEDVNSLPK